MIAAELANMPAHRPSAEDKCANLHTSRESAAKLRAERRAGELLREQEKNPGGRPLKNQSHDTTSFDKPKLSDIGIKKDQSSRWQRMADIPEKEFEQHVVKNLSENTESAKIANDFEPVSIIICTAIPEFGGVSMPFLVEIGLFHARPIPKTGAISG